MYFGRPTAMRLRWHLITVLVYAYLAVWSVLVSDAAIDSATFDFDTNVREWFRILHVDDSYLLLGGEDRLYNVSLDRMTLNNVTSIKTDAAGMKNCPNFNHYANNDLSFCSNYIRTAIKVDDSKYVICGTNAATSRCYSYDRNGTSDDWVQTAMPPSYSSPPFAPPFPWMNFTLLRTSENVLYTGGSIIDFTRRMSHVVFRNGSADGSLRQLLSIRSSETAVHSLRVYLSDVPVEARIYPNFVSSFETAEHVYWVFSEPALELQPFVNTVTSRVARVCKNDMSHERLNGGEYVWQLNTFTTYWKAQLECSMPGMYHGFKQYAYDQLGYNTFYFNVIADTSSLGNGSIFPRPQATPTSSIVYGVFNTDRNSIRGSAICAYEYASLVAPFSGPLLSLDAATDPLMSSTSESTWTWSIVNFDHPVHAGKPHPATCVNDSRAKHENDIYPNQAMLLDHIKPLSNKPLFFQTDHTFQLTHLVVDWQVRALDGRYYDILFAGTDSGDLLKIVNVGGDNELTFTVIEKRTVASSAIGELQLINRHDQKVLLVNTFESVRQIKLERCSASLTCAACVALRDPYCSWNPAAGSCIASYDGSQSGNYQDIRRGHDSRCPALQTIGELRKTTVAAAVQDEHLATRPKVVADGTAPRPHFAGSSPAESAVAADEVGPLRLASGGSDVAFGLSRQTSAASDDGGSCPLCIFIVPTAVGLFGLFVGFGIGWASSRKCARPKSPYAHEKVALTAEQHLLNKMNNTDKGAKTSNNATSSSKAAYV